MAKAGFLFCMFFLHGFNKFISFALAQICTLREPSGVFYPGIISSLPVSKASTTKETSGIILVQNRSSANRNNDPPQCENDTFTTNGISTHFQSKPNEYSKSSETKHPFKDNLSSTGINVEKPR
jgi:hypothetical protein